MMLVWTIPDVCYRYLGTLQIFQEITIKEEQRSFARQECDFFTMSQPYSEGKLPTICNEFHYPNYWQLISNKFIIPSQKNHNHNSQKILGIEMFPQCTSRAIKHNFCITFAFLQLGKQNLSELQTSSRHIVLTQRSISD